MSDNSVHEYKSPLNAVNWRFSDYLSRKKTDHAKHIIGHNITDYAYSLDLETRKMLDTIPGLFNMAKKICSTEATKAMHIANQDYLAVGPNQFPEVYRLGCECASTLGIGIPNLYISNDETFNAFAYGSDDIEPFIVIGNLFLKRYSLSELKAVIGHECGHIQNGHVPYYTLANGLLNMGTSLASNLIKRLAGILTTGAMMTIKTWSRACEVTADRAGLICAEMPDDFYRQTAKIMYGAVELDDKEGMEVNIEALREQMEFSMNNPSRIIELYADHPMTTKRIFAGMEFEHCDVFYSWRPDLKKSGTVVFSKTETDNRCKKYIDVIKREKK